ncbi:MAG: SDR family NAD(P)-dependent oxidoreductase [Gemmobacter sp.]|nr:SDR family NAD(P)-dependent oxidoreductase [Gemmobacter sp.]
MTDPIRLDGKVAIVTGAASGIGRATALLMAERGAAVMAVDRADGAIDTANAIRSAGGQAGVMQTDCATESGIAAFTQATLAQFGRLDILHANAGISGPLVPSLSSDLAEFDAILRVNLIGTWLAIRAALPHMTHGASIICTASVAGVRAGAGGIPYSASKAGVINLVQTTARALTGTGIRINAVAPGLIETGMTSMVYEDARKRGREAKIGQLNPLRRGGEPAEIAQAVAFLASDAASYINGQTLAVDGGLTSSLPFSPRPVAGG